MQQRVSEPAAELAAAPESEAGWEPERVAGPVSAPEAAEQVSVPEVVQVPELAAVLEAAWELHQKNHQAVSSDSVLLSKAYLSETSVYR